MVFKIRRYFIHTKKKFLLLIFLVMDSIARYSSHHHHSLLSPLWNWEWSPDKVLIFHFYFLVDTLYQCSRNLSPLIPLLHDPVIHSFLRKSRLATSNLFNLIISYNFQLSTSKKCMETKNYNLPNLYVPLRNLFFCFWKYSSSFLNTQINTCTTKILGKVWMHQWKVKKSVFLKDMVFLFSRSDNFFFQIIVLILNKLYLLLFFFFPIARNWWR